MRRSCLNYVYELARQDDRVVFVGSDLGSGVLEDMKIEFPERWFMEGISEQHIIGMAAGLAMEGFLPYVNSIATFLTRRCYEQVAMDICLHNLPVRIIANGGGLVYAPLGPTHLATEDISILRCLPNMTIVAPCDAEEMKRIMPQTLSWPYPLYIRLAAGGDRVVSSPQSECRIGKSVLMREGSDILLVTTGVMTQRACEVADRLEVDNISCAVLHNHTVKPLDQKALIEYGNKVSLIVTIEENSLAGGLGSAVLELYSDNETSNPIPRIVRFGIPDKFAHEYGSQDSLLKALGLDSASLVTKVREKFLG